MLSRKLNVTNVRKWSFTLLAHNRRTFLSEAFSLQGVSCMVWKMQVLRDHTPACMLQFVWVALSIFLFLPSPVQNCGCWCLSSVAKVWEVRHTPDRLSVQHRDTQRQTISCQSWMFVFWSVGGNWQTSHWRAAAELWTCDHQNKAEEVIAPSRSGQPLAMVLRVHLGPICWFWHINCEVSQ